MAVCNNDGIKNTKLNIHSPKIIGMGLCKFNYVFYAIIPAFIAYCHAYTLFEYFFGIEIHTTFYICLVTVYV